MELAANPNYIRSQYLSLLFRFHILHEDVDCPPSPPYYSNQFFDHILRAVSSGLNIVKMTTRQWYFHLINHDLLKVIEDDAEVYRQCRVERLSPLLDWNIIWKRVRLACLSSSMMTFLWKLIHHLLPTEERISSTLGNIPSTCRLGCADNTEANLEHCLFSCILSIEVGSWLLETVRTFFPRANAASIINLDLPDNDAVLWIVAYTLQYVWSKRLLKRKATLISCVATLKSEALKLEGTHHSQLAAVILGIIE